MQKVLFQDAIGRVVLSLVMPCGFVPIMAWPTWSEFTAHVEFELDFIKYAMTHAMPGQIESFVNSLEKIDAIS